MGLDGVSEDKNDRGSAGMPRPDKINWKKQFHLPTRLWNKKQASCNFVTTDWVLYTTEGVNISMRNYSRLDAE